METYGGRDKASGNINLSTGQWNEYRVSSTGVKRPSRGVNHPSTSGVEVKETVDIYFPTLRQYMARYRENFPFLLDSRK